MFRRNTEMSQGKLKLKTIIYSLFSLSLLVSNLISAPYFNKTQVFYQPDGTELNLVLNGDEYYMEAATEDGWPVVRDHETGWICYAAISKDGSKFVSTGVHVGESTKEAAIAIPDDNNGTISLSLDAKLKIAGSNETLLYGKNGAPAYSLNNSSDTLTTKDISATLDGTTEMPATSDTSRFVGTVRGLVLIFDFSDATHLIQSANIQIK